MDENELAEQIELRDMMNIEALAELREMRRELSELRREAADSRRALEAILEFLNRIVVESIAAPQDASSEDGSDIPESFPYREELIRAGIWSLDEIPRTSKQLKRIDGIDEDAVVPIIRAVTRVAAKARDNK